MKTRKNNSNFLNRTRKSKDALVDKVNKIYENMLNFNGKHLFFRS